MVSYLGGRSSAAHSATGVGAQAIRLRNVVRKDSECGTTAARRSPPRRPTREAARRRRQLSWRPKRDPLATRFPLGPSHGFDELAHRQGLAFPDEPGVDDPRWPREWAAPPGTGGSAARSQERRDSGADSAVRASVRRAWRRRRSGTSDRGGPWSGPGGHVETEDPVGIGRDEEGRGRQRGLCPIRTVFARVAAFADVALPGRARDGRGSCFMRDAT